MNAKRSTRAPDGPPAPDATPVPAARRRIAAALAALLAVGASAGLLAGTGASFSSGSANTANDVSAGTITLSGGGAGGTMFDIAGMEPGEENTRCISLSNVGDQPIAELALYGTVGGTGLAAFLHYEVDLGHGAAGGASFSCAGFDPEQIAAIHGALTDFPTTTATFNDVGAVPLDPGMERSYRFTVTLPGDVAVAAQNSTATFDVTWVGDA